MKTNNSIKNELIAAARKVCDSECIACYECGKSKTIGRTLPLIGKNTVCPLQKYNIEHNDGPKSFLERLQNDATLEDLDFLCEYCEHRDKSKDTPESFSIGNCYMTHCLDCPVQMYRDGIEECAAEARMS